MEEFIENPETGRRILVGGPTYNNLLEQGLPVNDRRKFPVIETKDVRPVKKTRGGPSDARMREIMNMDLFQVPPLSQQKKLAKAPWQERRFETLMSNVGEGRGSATRGWSLRQPQRGRERHELMNACGPRCFLGENESFPICPSCENYEGECQCLIDCDGANAAFVRARQWKHTDIANAAETILREKCKRTPKRGKRSRQFN